MLQLGIPRIHLCVLGWLDRVSPKNKSERCCLSYILVKRDCPDSKLFVVVCKGKHGNAPATV